MAASSVYSVRRNSSDDRRSSKRPHPTTNGLYTDTSLNTRCMVVPFQSQSTSPATAILNMLFNLGCQSYRKLSPTSCPCYGQMFTAAQTHPYSPALRLSMSNEESNPTSFSQEGITSELNYNHQTLSSNALSSIILWHTQWRYLSFQLHCQCTRRHFSKVYWNFESSVSSKFQCLLSPFLVRTLASCANIIPPKSTDSSLHTKHTKNSSTECLATNDEALGNEIHSDTKTGSSTTDISMCASNENQEHLNDLEEVQGEDCYYSECDTDGDDNDVIFSDELDDTEQQQQQQGFEGPYIPCGSKVPSRPLMTLLSEESGFGESSLTESYSDEEWDDEEQETENLVTKITESYDTWKIFEAQALSPMPTITSKECPSHNQSQTLYYKGCQSSSKPSCLSHRLSSFNVCAHRHRNCCSPRTTINNNDSPVSRQHKKVSFVCDAKLINVHHIVVWNFAYRSCRKGPWEQYARDRMHFRCRINRVSSVIEPCLQKKLEFMRNYCLKPPS